MRAGRRRHRSARVSIVLAGLLMARVACAQPPVAMIIGGTQAADATDATITPSGPGVILSFDAAGTAPIRAPTMRRLSALAPIVAEAAQASGLDAALLLAVIHAESAGDPRAVSPKGAAGLMQLMPATGAEYGVTDRFDARQNVAAGARLLSGLFRRYGSRELALAAYNAGPGAVDRHGGAIPPYAETRQYVARVEQLYARYARAVAALP